MLNTHAVMTQVEDFSGTEESFIAELGRTLREIAYQIQVRSPLAFGHCLATFMLKDLAQLHATNLETPTQVDCCLQMEMDRCQLPMLDDTGLEDLKPHTLIAVQNLWQLPDILERVPPSVIWPISHIRSTGQHHV